ncbi:MAG TPA: hypothetical protein VGX78_05560 [Pirellulales bacterium]|jgi:hypothetical protein|nr:hypothetical protein [Pirellulales bacterium]
MVFPLYLVGGLLLGLGDSLLGRWVQQAGVKPGVATAVSVNLLLPLLTIVLAVAYPRARMAWVGALGMTAAYILGLAVAHPPAKPWDAATVVRSIPPVLVVACVGYGVLGTLTAIATRRLGKSPQAGTRA